MATNKGIAFVGNVAAIRETNGDGAILTDKNGQEMASVVVIKNLPDGQVIRSEGLVFGKLNIAFVKDCVRKGDLVDLKVTGRRDTTYVDPESKVTHLSQSGILASVKVISRCTGTNPRTGKKVYGTPRNGFFAPIRPQREAEAEADAAVMADEEVIVA